MVSGPISGGYLASGGTHVLCKGGGGLPGQPEKGWTKRGATWRTSEVLATTATTPPCSTRLDIRPESPVTADVQSGELIMRQDLPLRPLTPVVVISRVSRPNCPGNRMDSAQVSHYTAPRC